MTNEPSAKRVRIQEPEFNEIHKYKVEDGSDDERDDDFDPDLEGLFAIGPFGSLNSSQETKRGREFRGDR